MPTPPMPYAGGKQALADRIVALMPPHDHYIEPYAGALSVLLAKPPAKVETINDLDGDIVTFWRVLRDQPGELERVCALTPHSRNEFRNAVDLDQSPTDLERARRVWVQLSQGRGARLAGGNGWRFLHGTNRMALARYLDGYLARIGPAADRLRQVSLESRDAHDVIDAYARPGALLYVDPPYLGDTRHGRQYRHELTTTTEHMRLLDQLTSTDAAVMLSGYAHPLYDEALVGWERHEFRASAMTGASRTEVLWCNTPPSPNLFEVPQADQSHDPVTTHSDTRERLTG